MDLDEEIVKTDGRSIPDIFAAEGEDGFRTKETAETQRFGKEGRQLISCGGGIVKKPENLRALHQNGIILFIDRPVDALAVGGGRPLSSSMDALRQMEAQRRPLYLAAADAVIPNNGTLDDALHDGLYRRICQVTEKPWTQEGEDAWRAELIKTYGDGADEELFCIPRQSSGAYLTTSMIEACMEDVPVLTWTPPAEDFVDWPLPVAERYTRGWITEQLEPLLATLPQDMAHFCGVDFGRSGDLSVFWPATEERDLRLVPPCILELRNCPHRTQQQILFAILDALPRFAGVSLDARGNGSALAEAARQQYGPEQVREVMISEAWYRETMPLLKAGIEDKTLLLPRDAGILSDFRSLRVVKGVARVPEQRVKDKTGGRHGDSVIACAMMLDARKELGSAEPWDYVGIPMSGFDFKGW